ncbi:dephospho-CoA kinase [Pectinatus frisingensis]|jgi:dephospho-CoA kinase|uniref:dephospho-CoA kinase n=1 Tax=Pectinatus frisingensis TaxID=865 RepID=UPI0015F64757|nr:dephospho-CoA kinase [Pectinatus frisingensis]
MYKIGLTGGIACGKTTICSFLQEFGASIIDTDKIAHELACPENSLWQAYYAHFGEKILLNDKTLNRRLIGNIVFSNSTEKNWLNKTSHPLILAEVKKRITRLTDLGIKIVILDVPLLYEIGWDRFVDETWVVYVDKKTQLNRLRQRNSYTFAEARHRIQSQMPLSRKIKYADKVINTGNPLLINKKNTYKLWTALQQKLEKINEQQ